VLEQIRKKTRAANIPVMGLADDRGEISEAIASRYDACHFKSERQAILDGVEKLISGGTAHDDDAPAASDPVTSGVTLH
jgi:hypothetical protein